MKHYIKLTDRLDRKVYWLGVWDALFFCVLPNSVDAVEFTSVEDAYFTIGTCQSYIRNHFITEVMSQASKP